MSGVNVVRYLLANNAGLTAQVPAARIKAGPLSVDTALPAIGITEITASNRNTVAMNEVKKFITERVQVTVIAKEYSAKKTILHLVASALPNTYGMVDDINVDSLIGDVEGPDIDDLALGLYIQTQDFIVRFNR